MLEILSPKPTSIIVDNKNYPVLHLPGRPKALLDKTVAEIYQVQTREINQAVKNNPKKFPEDFCFELNSEEMEFLKKDLKFSWKKGYYPKAFNHYGCNMLSTIIRSDIAIKRSIEIIKAFTLLEKTQTITRDEQWDLITAKIISAITNELDDLRLSLNKRIFALEDRITVLENNFENTKTTNEKFSKNVMAYTAKQKETLNYVKTHGKITNKDYRKLFNISQSTATRELNEMVRLSVLDKKSSGRSTFYSLSRL